MNKNENTVDRVVRIFLGLGLAGFAYANLTGVIQLIAYIVSLILVVTAISGFCLLYKIFNFSTLRKEKGSEEEQIEENQEKEE